MCRRLLTMVLTSAAILAQAPAPPTTDLRELCEQVQADLRDLQRRYDTPMSAADDARLSAALRERLTQLDAIRFDDLAHDARIDWLLLGNWCRHELDLLQRRTQQDQELAGLLPFAARIAAFGERQRAMQPDDPERDAAALQQLSGDIAALAGDAAMRDTPLPIARRALGRIEALRRCLRRWFEFRNGYDPAFGWWVGKPFEAVDQALQRHRDAVQRQLIDSRTGDASLVGDPIGAAALQQELQFEGIPYTAAELVAIAEREFAWCDAQMLAQARALGCGDDWRQALELVKQRHRRPGEQPQLIKELAEEAIAFLEQRDLITVPALAKECWLMSMMSPQAQRVNPFFLGGRTIQVSFPTDAMTHDEKLQSLRSNNEHFCRATVHHELIPGHWLQQYSQARHRSHRQMFETPFWIEGWALYWEMRLYDMDFAHGPEDRVGMLYWRKHRCARIVFSLNYHLGTWTGPQCVDYLIERVGHERAAAEGEVRRSLTGGYGPLYQAAYMLGGLQFRALHQEIVGSGRSSERAFHDAVLQQNSMPVSILRLALRAEPPPRQPPPWRFAGS